MFKSLDRRRKAAACAVFSCGSGLHSLVKGVVVFIFILLGGVHSIEADCYPNPSGLVAWWPSDGNANDIVGTNNGALMGGATAATAGMVGNAFNFEATNSFIQIPDSGVLRPVSFTCETWVRFSGLDSASNLGPGRQCIVFKENSIGLGLPGYEMGKARIAGGDVFVFKVTSVAGELAQVSGTNFLATNVWYHFACVRGSNFIRMYVNGQLQSQTNVGFPQDYGVSPLYFGSSGQPLMDGKFRGVLDEVSLYNRALTSSEIASIYSSGTFGKCKEVVITSPPVSQVTTNDGYLAFAVSATGLGPLHYQWRKGGSPMIGQTGSILAFSDITANEAGSYDVVVTNLLNSVTSAPPAILTVLPPISFPPFVTSSPQSQTVGLGEDLTLGVSAGGTSPLSYQWRVGGVPIAGQTSAVLTLSNVWYTNSGNYDVVIANGVGSVTSAVATLTVKLFPDPQLEAAIACTLKKTSETLGIQDLQALTNLFVRNRGIANLSGIQFATNLAFLDACENYISDLGPLQGLVNLASLQLDENRSSIVNLAPLSGLTNLSCLLMGRVVATNYSALGGLTNLSTLTLRRGNVINLDFLQNLKQLSTLSLPENSITSLSALSGLTNLRSLDVRWNYIFNQTPAWSSPTNLEVLYLAVNPLTNVPALQSSPRLRHLILDDCGIKNISTLSGLTNLSYLGLSRNPITNYSVLGGMTGLVNLELTGNSFTNLTTLSNLWRLNYADLSYNGITSISPLAGLTNLRSLVVAGNPLMNFSQLSTLSSVTNLWLHNNSITNSGFISSLTGLRYLNLDANQISNLSGVSAWNNLTGLGLSRNLASDYSSVGLLTNLTSLRLDGNSISNLIFISNLRKLTYLSLEQNQISAGITMTVLTNVKSLYLGENRLSDISFLQFLPNLHEVDLSLNLLNPTNGSPELSVIQDLHCMAGEMPSCGCPMSSGSLLGHGVNVRYLPQHQLPGISAVARWFIPSNTNSTLRFNVFYDVSPSDPLPVSGSSSSVGLIANDSLVFSSTNNVRLLTVSPVTNQTGVSTLTLSVMNRGGLVSNATVTVYVANPINATNMLSAGLTSLNVGLEAGVRRALGKESGVLTSVDLLNLTALTLINGDLNGFTGWQWLTNLTSLNLHGTSIADVSFLTNLTQLTALSINDTSVTNLSPVSSLTNLTSLEIAGASVSSLEFISPLIRLTHLEVNRTRVSDIARLSGLTNLTELDLQYNRIADVQTLTSLPSLAAVDVRFNILDTIGDLQTSWAISYLEAKGVNILYVPQRTAPLIQIAPTWNVSANATSILTFTIKENGVVLSDTVSTGATSSNQSLIPNAGLAVTHQNFTFGPTDWLLSAATVIGQTGTATITIFATNDVGQYSAQPVTVSVQNPLPLNNSFFGLTNGGMWQSAGDAPWYGQAIVTCDGLPSAQSGSIGNSGQSVLESEIIGPGTLSFRWKVSSEQNFDWLTFETDEVTNRISGEVNWQQKVLRIMPGTNHIRWRYAKDLSIASGADAAWLADVNFTPGTLLQSVSGSVSGGFSFNIFGFAGQTYEIQTSTNLVNWSVLTVLQSTNAIMPFTDGTATNANRYYRTKLLAPIQGSPLPLTLFYTLEPDGIMSLSWFGDGILEGALIPGGPWSDITNSSPFQISTHSSPNQFFRVRFNSN